MCETHFENFFDKQSSSKKTTFVKTRPNDYCSKASCSDWTGNDYSLDEKRCIASTGNDYEMCLAWTGNEGLARLYSLAFANIPFT